METLSGEQSRLSGVRADMLVRGNRLFVYTNDGTLKAYDVETRN